MVVRARAPQPCARWLRHSILCSLIVAVCAVGSGIADDGGATAAASPSPSASVRLVGETPFIREPSGVLSLTLTRTGPLAHPHATVQLTLFDRLTTRDGLEAAIGQQGPSGVLAQTRPLPARCLPRTASTVGVAVGVAPNGARLTAPSQCAGRAPILRLGCTTGCDGVYPLRVTSRGGGGVFSFVTLVTFAASSATPLRVAWVLRVAGATDGLSASDDVLRGLASHPLVPVTVAAQGAAVARGFTTHAGATSLALLRAALTGSAHELLAEAYAPANLGALRASHLNGEVIDQFALTDVVLADADRTAAPSRAVTYGTGPQTPTSAAAVRATGFRDLIVDGSDLAQDPSGTLTWGAPFTLLGASPSPTALATDSTLSALSDATAADPALVAAQFLGELAFLHFEQPDLAEPRVVTVLTDATTQVTTSFTDDVLLGLSDNPVLRPVTASDAFASVPVGANGFPAVRALALGPSRPWPKFLVREISFLRITTDALASAVGRGTSPIPRIDGALLLTERVLPEKRRWALLQKVHRSLELEVGNFRIYAGPITLTGTGPTSIPITVFSNAPYTVHGDLELSSRWLAFPSGSKIPLTLTGSVDSVRVAARALVTGDLPLSVRFVSPDQNIVLARASITVRATGFSVVGIILTVLAALVLAAWWVRTARRRRRAH